MRVAIWMVVVGGVGCGSQAAKPDAGEQRDAEPVDALADASIDAFPDAPPLPSTCGATAAILLDVAPRRISSFAISGSTMYVSTYRRDPDTQMFIDPIVTIIDRTTGLEAEPPLVPAGLMTLFQRGSSILAIDANTIWKLQPGMAPVALITGRDQPRIATLDATHLYWVEREGMTDVVRRRAFARGSSVEDVTDCAAPLILEVDATYLYCPPWGDAPKRVPKGGGSPMSWTYGGNIVTAAVMDNDAMYFTDANPFQQLWKLQIPNGPITLVDMSTSGGRYTGLAMSPTYFYIVDSGSPALRRIRRATLEQEVILAGSAVYGGPLLDGNKLYFLAQDQVEGAAVMHCVD